MTAWFDTFARRSAHALATPTGFIVYLGVIAAWHILWWAMGWDPLLVNQLTLYLSILTQGTAQLIRYGEETSSQALHAKLDILIAGNEQVSNALIGAEQKSPREIEQLRDACASDQEA